MGEIAGNGDMWIQKIRKRKLMGHLGQVTEMKVEEQKFVEISHDTLIIDNGESQLIKKESGDNR